MIRREKEIKRKFLVLFFISLILISNVLIFHNLNIQKKKEIDDNYYKKELDKSPKISDPNLYDYINGTGVNQDVRVYGNNISENLNDNREFFEIPTYSSDDMYLTYGDFNFTFQNNFTTDYIIEDNNALYPLGEFIYYDFNSDQNYSKITWNPEAYLDGDWNDLVDDDPSNTTCIELNATNNRVLNFTIAANFSDTSSTPYNLEFNRSHILGLLSSLIFDISVDANLTIKIRDFTQPVWNNVTDKIYINSSFDVQRINNRFINENLNYINFSNTCYIQFYFERYLTTEYSIQLFNFDFKSTYALDLPITNTSYVALEFDLKGLKSTVNGFYAWIRTLDLQEASNAELNISIFLANTTVIRDDDLYPTGENLRVESLKPNMSISSLIDTNITQYFEDKPFYFKFNADNTSDLELYNYFIVIKSNISRPIYSLVGFDYYAFGDNKTEHQLKITINDGGTWKNAIKKISSFEGQLDASSFRLNVTRGYMPSDFIINNNQTLRIQDLPFENLKNKLYPYNQSSYLTWGLGRWNHNFTNPIEDNASNIFRIDLKWNNTITKGFTFNLTYSINAYWIENAITTYNVTYNEDPKWIFQYNLNKGSQKFKNWSLFEFWFVYHNYFNAQNLTNPDSEKILNITVEQKVIENDSGKYKVVIANSSSNPSGAYLLELISFNFINKMNSYINYHGTLWETNGFMYGDNISISAAVQDHLLNAPKTGDMNVTIFYPNGTLYTKPILKYSSSIIDEAVLFYDFNNRTILNLTNEITVFGEYHLGFFWFNGSAIGCKELTIYIDAYDIELEGFDYSSDLNKNIFSGKLNNMVYDNYTILIASVNETTGNPNPDFYPIINNEVNEQFFHEIEGQQLPVEMKSFNQNENILNPNETVNIKTAIQNIHPFISLDVKIQVNLISCANEEWIIAQDTSESVELSFSGHPNDTYEFSVNLTIPNLNKITKIWPGVNAPVRLGGIKTKVTVFIEDTDVGDYISKDYSLMSNQTKELFDGYIIALRTVEETGSPSIINIFERNESIYYPGPSIIMVNIYDHNFVSSYDQFSAKFYLKQNSKFINITITPNNPINGQIINIESILVTEFEEAISNRNVTFQYYNDKEWIMVDTKLSDHTGYTIFSINTIDINFTEDLTVKLLWNGDIFEGVSKNITINIIHEVNELSININQNNPQIYRNRKNTLTITLHNKGDSNFRVSNINITLSNELKYSIVEVDNLQLNSLSPGETTHLVIEIRISEIKILEINVSILVQNILTSENLTFSRQSSFKLYDPPIYDYFISLFSFLIIALFFIIWVIAIIYSRKTMKKIEAPVEEIPKRPRKGRYVKVSEIKKPTPTKIISKKKEELREKISKEKTDLDTLLEERGLAEKKKKTEK